MKQIFKSLLLGCSWLVACETRALPELGISGGTNFGNNVYVARVVYSDQIKYRMSLGSGRAIHFLWEASGGGWDGSGLEEHGISFFAARCLARTPLDNSQHNFIEVGLGPMVLDDQQLGNHRSWGYNLQFESHLGITRYIPGSRYYVGYRVQHVSNGGLGDLNPGVNFHTLSIGKRL